MSWAIVEGNRKQFKGKFRGQWGKLTDDHLDVIAGRCTELAGKIREIYGLTKEDAKKTDQAFRRVQQGGPDKTFLLMRSPAPAIQRGQCHRRQHR